MLVLFVSWGVHPGLTVTSYAKRSTSIGQPRLRRHLDLTRRVQATHTATTLPQQPAQREIHVSIKPGTCPVLY